MGLLVMRMRAAASKKLVEAPSARRIVLCDLRFHDAAATHRFDACSGGATSQVANTPNHCEGSKIPKAVPCVCVRVCVDDHEFPSGPLSALISSRLVTGLTIQPAEARFIALINLDQRGKKSSSWGGIECLPSCLSAG